MAEQEVGRKRGSFRLRTGDAGESKPGERLFGKAMTSVENRERGVESKVALKQEQEFKAAARRNRMLGEWAAGLMGLQGDHVAEYAKAVVKSDLELPGDDDVLRKVFEDLKGAGVSVSEGDVRNKMGEYLAVARQQIRDGK